MTDEDLEKRLSDITQGMEDCDEPEVEEVVETSSPIDIDLSYKPLFPASKDDKFEMPDLSKPLFPISDISTSKLDFDLTFPWSTKPKKKKNSFDYVAFNEQMERMNTKEEEIIKERNIKIILESCNGYPTERYRIFSEVNGKRTQLYEHQYFTGNSLMNTDTFKERAITCVSLSPDKKRLAFESIADKDSSIRSLTGGLSFDRVRDLHVVYIDGTHLETINLGLPWDEEDSYSYGRGVSLDDLEWVNKNTLSIEAKTMETVSNPNYDNPLFKNMYLLNKRHTTREGDKYRATIKLDKQNKPTVSLEKVEEE